MTGKAPSVAFVGAFNAAGSSIRGGQLSACRALLASPLASHYRFHLIDSTQESVPPAPLPRRAGRAVERLVHFTWRMVAHRDDAALIFVGDGLGFLEKGLMVLLARTLRRRVVLAPRSGILVDDYARGAAWRFFIRTVLRSASVVVCQSRTWQRTFAEWGVPEERLTVIPNWIDLRTYTGIPLPETESVNVLRLLFLGQVEAAKGIFDLIEAVSQARGSAKLALTVAGEGSALSAARRRAKEKGLDDCVRFIGWVDENGRLERLALSDVLVLPSYREGLPNAILEAMAAARPAIAARVGGIPDLVEEQVTGLLFEPGDVSTMAACMIRLAEQPALVRHMGIRARERALADHSVAAGASAIRRALDGRTTS